MISPLYPIRSPASTIGPVAKLAGIRWRFVSAAICALRLTKEAIAHDEEPFNCSRKKKEKTVSISVDVLVWKNNVSRSRAVAEDQGNCRGSIRELKCKMTAQHCFRSRRSYTHGTVRSTISATGPPPSGPWCSAPPDT